MSCKVLPCVLSFYVHFQQAKCCQCSLAKVFPLPLKYAHTYTGKEWKLKNPGLMKSTLEALVPTVFPLQQRPKPLCEICRLRSPVYAYILNSYAGSSGFSTIFSLPYTFGHSYRLLSTGKRAYKQSRRGCHLLPPDLLEDTKSVQLCTKTCVHRFSSCASPAPFLLWFFSSFLQYKVNHHGGINLAPSRWTMNLSEDVKPTHSSPKNTEKTSKVLTLTSGLHIGTWEARAFLSCSWKPGIRRLCSGSSGFERSSTSIPASCCHTERSRGKRDLADKGCRLCDFSSAADPRRASSTYYYF